MDILLIAPLNPDLPGLNAEIAAISSFHNVTALVGEQARQVDIADAIAEHPDGFQCIWFASHGSDLGIQISDEILTADGVAQYISASRARLCVLNTCASEALARQIIVGTDCDLIYTIADLLDSDSLRFGTLLAGELAKTDNFRQAFDLASPKRGRYKYLAAKAVIRALDATVSGELQKLGARVDETVRTAYQAHVDAKSMTGIVSDLKLQMTTLQQSFEILRQQSQTRDMREDLRKEERNAAMTAMDRKIDANTGTTAPATAQVHPPAPLVSVATSSVSPALLALLILLAVSLVVVAFFAGRGL